MLGICDFYSRLAFKQFRYDQSHEICGVADIHWFTVEPEDFFRENKIFHVRETAESAIDFGFLMHRELQEWTQTPWSS